MATEVRRSARGHIPRKDGVVYTINDFIDDDDEAKDTDFHAHEDVSDSETPEERAERLAEEAALENADDSSLDSDDGLDTGKPAPKKRKTDSDAPKKKSDAAPKKSSTAAPKKSCATAAAVQQGSDYINNMFGIAGVAKKKSSSTTIVNQVNGGSIVIGKQTNCF